MSLKDKWEVARWNTAAAILGRAIGEKPRGCGRAWHILGTARDRSRSRWCKVGPHQDQACPQFPPGKHAYSKSSCLPSTCYTPGIVLTVYTYPHSVSTELYFVDKEAVERRLDSALPGFSYVFFRLLLPGIIRSNLPTAWISWWSNDTLWVKTFGELRVYKPLRRELQLVTMRWWFL